MNQPQLKPLGSPFAQAPFIVIWEVTRACQLACRHCRAESMPLPDPRQLTTEESRTLLTQVREDFGPVLFVLTGGDPLERSDLFELVAHGAKLGLRMAVTPSATPKLTRDALARMRDAGLTRVAVSLDGVDAAAHDRFRQIDGTFDRTINALTWAAQLGMSRQINTSVHPGNRADLARFAEIGAYAGIDLWSVFFLVPTGRAGRDDLLSPAEHELAWRELARIALDPATPFAVKTTAGQPYYRVLAQERARRGLTDEQRIGLRAPPGVNDGNGFFFISNTGDFQPSGFLPIPCGNLREQRPGEVYRDHPLFRSLRSPDQLGGKCGVCPFNRRCGGSRSRAYGLTGDPMAADPTCVYQPPAWRERTMEQQGEPATAN